MTRGPVITVSGLDELRRDVRRIKDRDLSDELRRVNRELADDVLRIAIAKVPVKSGRLRASLRASGTVSDAIGRAGGASVPYAAAIHWGRNRGGRIVGRPFLREAANEIERDVEDRYRRVIDRVMDTIRSR